MGDIPTSYTIAFFLLMFIVPTTIIFSILHIYNILIKKNKTDETEIIKYTTQISWIFLASIIISSYFLASNIGKPGGDYKLTLLYMVIFGFLLVFISLLKIKYVKQIIDFIDNFIQNYQSMSLAIILTSSFIVIGWLFGLFLRNRQHIITYIILTIVIPIILGYLFKFDLKQALLISILSTTIPIVLSYFPIYFFKNNSVSLLNMIVCLKSFVNSFNGSAITCIFQRFYSLASITITTIITFISLNIGRKINNN